MPGNEMDVVLPDHGVASDEPLPRMHGGKQEPSAPGTSLGSLPDMHGRAGREDTVPTAAQRGMSYDGTAGSGHITANMGGACEPGRADKDGQQVFAMMDGIELPQGAASTSHKLSVRRAGVDADTSRGLDGSAGLPEKTLSPYVDYSLGIFSRTNPLRAACIRLASSRHAQSLVLLVILVNCIFLTFYDPTRGEHEGRNRVFNGAETPLALFYIIEMVIKVVALGLVADRRCFLRDPWNVLDFVVVIGSLVALMPNVQASVASIRSVRVLRVLRAVSLLPGVRRLVGTILRSLPILAHVMLLFAFLYLLFGILGVQLFGGNLMSRCFVSGLLAEELGDEFDEGEGIFHANIEHAGLELAGDDVCTNASHPWRGNICDLSRGAVCLHYRNPNYGLMSFDDILQAFVTIFEIISLEGWTDIMYACMDGTSGWAFVYFVVLVFSGSFFLLNLALAVITDVHAETSEEEDLFELSHKSPTQPKPGWRDTLSAFLERHPWLQAAIARVAAAFASIRPLALLARQLKVTLWDPPACHHKYRLAFFRYFFEEAEAVQLTSPGAHTALLATKGRGGQVGAGSRYNVLPDGGLKSLSGAGDRSISVRGVGLGSGHVNGSASRTPDMHDGEGGLSCVPDPGDPHAAPASAAKQAHGRAGNTAEDGSGMDAGGEMDLSGDRVGHGPGMGHGERADLATSQVSPPDPLPSYLQEKNVVDGGIGPTCAARCDALVCAECDEPPGRDPGRPGVRKDGPPRGSDDVIGERGDATMSGEHVPEETAGPVPQAGHAGMQHCPPTPHDPESLLPPPGIVVPESDAPPVLAPHRALSMSSEWPAREAAALDTVGGDRDMSASEEMHACCVFSPQGRRHGVRCLFAKLVYSRPFVIGIHIGIVINTAAMACVYYGMPKAYKNAQDNIGITLTIVFAIEMVLKLVGMGVRVYVTDPAHLFDGLVATISIVELACSPSGDGGSLLGLRMFRLLRLLRIIRRLRPLRSFLISVYRTAVQMGNLALILALLIFIYALLGMQLFGGRLDALPEGKPRSHFDTLLWASVTVFQVLTGENWTDVMHNAVRATSRWAQLYFLSLVILGNYLVLNLFLAILLNNLGTEDDKEGGDVAGDSVAGASISKKGGGSARSMDGSTRPRNAAVRCWIFLTMRLGGVRDRAEAKVAGSNASIQVPLKPAGPKKGDEGEEGHAPVMEGAGVPRDGLTRTDAHDSVDDSHAFDDRCVGDGDGHAGRLAGGEPERVGNDEAGRAVNDEAGHGEEEELIMFMLREGHGGSPDSVSSQGDEGPVDGADVAEGQQPAESSDLVGQASGFLFNPLSRSQLGEAEGSSDGLTMHPLAVDGDMFSDYNPHDGASYSVRDASAGDVAGSSPAHEDFSSGSASGRHVAEYGASADFPNSYTTWPGRLEHGPRASIEGLGSSGLKGAPSGVTSSVRPRRASVDHGMHASGRQKPGFPPSPDGVEPHPFPHRVLWGKPPYGRPWGEQAEDNADVRGNGGSASPPASTLPGGPSGIVVRAPIDPPQGPPGIHSSMDLRSTLPPIRVTTARQPSRPRSSAPAMSLRPSQLTRGAAPDLPAAASECTIVWQPVAGPNSGVLGDAEAAASGYPLGDSRSVERVASVSMREGGNDKAAIRSSRSSGRWLYNQANASGGGLDGVPAGEEARGDCQHRAGTAGVAGEGTEKPHDGDTPWTRHAGRIWALLPSCLRGTRLFPKESFPNKEKCLKEELLVEGGLASPYSNASEGGQQAKQRAPWNPVPFDSLDDFQGRSCGVFSTTCWLRRWCFAITQSHAAHVFVVALIVASCATLAYESPAVMRKNPQRARWHTVNLAFAIAFNVEVAVKMVAWGVVLNPGSYLRSPWNVFDLAVALAALIPRIFVLNQQTSFVRALHAVRVMRPLRLVVRVPELHVVFSALVASLRGLLQVVLVAGIFWLAFGIVGMELFMGKFHYCTDDSLAGEPKSACVGNDTSGEPREYLAYEANFDNILNAMLTLFQMSTTEGWVDVMNAGVDAVGIDRASRRDEHSGYAVFFVLYMCAGSFFLVNLFTGTVVDNFSRQMEAATTVGTFMTAQQRAWVRHIRSSMRFSLRRPRHIYQSTGIRHLVIRCVDTATFERAILAIIFVNVVFMAVRHHGQNPATDRVLTIASNVFTCIYVAEAALKLVAYGFKGYFSSKMNCFDFCLVIVSLLAIATSSQFNPLFRVFRMVRLMHIVHVFPKLHTLVITLLVSIPMLANTLFFIATLFFIFAVLGMQLFGQVRWQGDLNAHANFSNLGYSLLLLLRMVTGESWNGIMYECMASPEGCEQVGDCGYRHAWIYFVVFVVLGTYVLFNLFIAVLLENFEASRMVDENQVHLKDLQSFRKKWIRLFDRGTTNFIPVNQFRPLLCAVPPPLGIGGKALTDTELEEVFASFAIPPTVKHLYYQDVLVALTQRAMGIAPADLPQHVREQLDRKMAKSRDRDLATAVKRARHQKEKQNSKGREDEEEEKTKAQRERGR